jgi:hypothetical protein
VPSRPKPATVRSAAWFMQQTSTSTNRYIKLMRATIPAKLASAHKELDKSSVIADISSRRTLIDHSYELLFQSFEASITGQELTTAV